jgi:C-methyltransferase
MEDRTSPLTHAGSAAPVKLGGAPPPAIFRAVVALRNWLLRLADRLVPAQVALIDRLGGYYLLHVVHAAAELKIADELASGSKSTPDLARAVGAAEEPLERLMRALASYGVFARGEGDRWENNRLSFALVSAAPGSMRDLALFVGSPYHLGAWHAFVGSVRSGAGAFRATHGRGLFDYFQDHPQDGARFDGAMVALTNMDAPALALAYPFSALGDAKVCDVAGGRGTLLANILARHPRLRGVLFDDEKVVAGAPPLLKAYGIADRTEVVGGSFFERVPGGCAVYVLKDILHDWDDERAVAILKVVRAAMGPASRLVVAEMVVDRVEDRYFGTLLDLEMLAIMDGGKQRSAAQFRALFAAADLELTRVIAAGSPTSLVEAAVRGA